MIKHEGVATLLNNCNKIPLNKTKTVEAMTELLLSLNIKVNMVLKRCHDQVVRVNVLWCLQVQPRLGHLANGKLSLSKQQQNSNNSESAKDKAAKREEWVPHFKCYVQDTEGF